MHQFYGIAGYVFYHGLYGNVQDKAKAFKCFKIGSEGKDSLSLYYMGIMCELYEAPEGEYDWYDAETFMTLCTDHGGCMAQYAMLWLGDYFADSAKGGDPEEAIDYYKASAKLGNKDAIKILTDYYLD
jgi:TPR repeat protein